MTSRSMGRDRVRGMGAGQAIMPPSLRTHIKGTAWWLVGFLTIIVLGRLAAIFFAL